MVRPEDLKMKIKMTRPHGSYKKGDVLELPVRQAESLIAWEYAVRDHQEQLIETAAVEPEVETADVTPRRRRK